MENRSPQEKLTDGILDGIRGHLDVYVDSILAAYKKADPKKGMSLSFPVKLTVGKDDSIQVQTKINFAEGKVSDMNVRTVDGKQLGLFSDEPKRYPAGG